MATSEFNPLTRPMPSIAVIRARAKARAHAATLAALGQLPDSATLRQANASLVKSIGETAGGFGGLVSHLGAGYQNAVAQAHNDLASGQAALGVTGAPAHVDNRSGLLGALAAGQLGVMTAAQMGAQQQLPGQLAELAGKQNAAKSGETKAFWDYYSQGLDDALKLGAAKSNAELSNLQLESTNANREAQLDQGQQRIDIAQQNADTARGRLAATLKGNTNTDEQKAIKAAAAQIDKVLGGKATVKKLVAYDYKFKIRNTLGGKDYDATVRAPNGNAARAQFLQQVQQAKASGDLPMGITFDPHGNYFTGDRGPGVYTTSTVAGTKQAAIDQALPILIAAGMSRSRALAYARKLVGVGKPKKKAKPKASNPGATSSQSR